MNDYREILPFLKQELEKIEQPELRLSVQSVVEVLESEGSDLADAAVREYSATLLWPRVSDRVRFELCLRLRVAIFWIEGLQDTSTDGETLQDFLESTMIDYWRDEGRWRWVWNHFVNPDSVV